MRLRSYHQISCCHQLDDFRFGCYRQISVKWIKQVLPHWFLEAYRRCLPVTLTSIWARWISRVIFRFMCRILRRFRHHAAHVSGNHRIIGSTDSAFTQYKKKLWRHSKWVLEKQIFFPDALFLISSEPTFDSAAATVVWVWQSLSHQVACGCCCR